MTRVVNFVFNNLFQEKETVSYKEKRNVVVATIFVLLAISSLLYAV